MNKKQSGKKKNTILARLPSWINFQNLLFLLVILIFLVIIIWSDPLSQYLQKPIDDPAGVDVTATTLPGTPTPLPDEWISSSEQTSGIILGATVIIIAITVGTAVVLLRDREK